MKTIRLITLPSGRRVTIGEYVRSWKTLKTLPPNRLVDRWSHFPTPAGEILREISYGVHDRINKHLPWWNRGRKWAEDWYRETRQAADRINHPQKTDKAELKMFVSPFYFRVNQNKADPPSSIVVKSEAGEVLVTYPNRYSKLENEDALAPILGDDLSRYVRQSFTLSIKGEELPVGQEQEVVDAIQALLEAYGALGALEVKEELKPTPDFHTARLRQFTPEQNMAIERVWPIVAMVKTKGRE